MGKDKLYTLSTSDQEELFELTKEGLGQHGWKVYKEDNLFFVEIETDEEPLTMQFSTVFELNAFSAGVGIGLLLNEEMEDAEDEDDCVEFEANFDDEEDSDDEGQ